MQERIEIGQYLVIDPEICHGQLTFKGTRVPVKTVLYFISTGRSIEELRRGWPEVSAEAITEAVTLASEALQKQYFTKAPTLAS